MRKFYFGLDLGHHDWKVSVLEENPNGDFISFHQAVKNESLIKGEIADEQFFINQLDNIFTNLSESLDNYPIREVSLAVSLPQFQSHLSKGYTFPPSNIEAEDIEKAVRMAKTSIALSNQEVLLDSPSQFILDNEQVVRDPKGMNAKRLDVEVVFVTAFKPLIEKIRQGFRELKIIPIGPIPSIFAGSLLSLSKKEKEIGSLLIDAGAVTTAVTLFQEGTLQDFKMFKFGQQNLTEDLALHLKISPEEAEEIKISLFSTEEQKKRKRNTLGSSGRKKASFQRAAVQKFLERTLKDYMLEFGLSDYVKEIRKKRKVMGAMLMGGGAKLAPLPEWFKNILSLPIKTAKTATGVLEEKEDNINYFASAGCAYLLYRSTGGVGFWQKLKNVFKNFIG